MENKVIRLHAVLCIVSLNRDTESISCETIIERAEKLFQYILKGGVKNG